MKGTQHHVDVAGSLATWRVWEVGFLELFVEFFVLFSLIPIRLVGSSPVLAKDCSVH